MKKNNQKNLNKNIAHVIYDKPGGAGNVVFTLIDRLYKDYNIKQDVIMYGQDLIFSPYYKKYHNKFNFKVVKKKLGFDVAFFIRLLKTLKKEKYDLIFLHDSTASLYGRMLKVFSFKTKIISVYHGARPESKLFKFIDSLSGFLFNSGIVCVSNSVKNALPTVLRKKANVIYNGIDIYKFKRKSTESTSNNIPVISTICRLEYPKDPFTLVNACKVLSESRVPFKCKIAGDGSLFNEIEDFIVKCGLKDKVELLGWQDNIGKLLEETDIFVLSTYSEGLGIVILEAMASSLPVIASNVGGIPELIEENKNGFLFDPGNHNQLAKKLKDLIYNKHMQKEFSCNSRKMVKRFSYDEFAKSWANYINDILYTTNKVN